MKIGAHYSGNSTCEFIVWAPFLNTLGLKMIPSNEKLIPMEKDTSGYWKTVSQDVPPGTDYLYHLEGEKDRPDPASYFQPKGVHKASQVVDHTAFQWEDSEWKGIPLSEMILYELHIGTFTPEGNFEAIMFRLDALKEIGINALLFMPVAQFPGERNWGYDGVYPFAVQASYGGPDGLKKLVNECHKKDMAVILDVVYNHLGPEGNYLRDYGPYFTDYYKTPWGQAINFDGPHSNEVRNFFTENALSWFENYHIDALRLDAIHGIYDMSARHFLLELAERVEEFSKQHGRKFYLIAESDLNNSRVIRPKLQGGYGIDAQWCDDFHHSLRTLLTGEKEGYYIDFGRTEHLVKSLKEGFVYSGQYSRFRNRNHGNFSGDVPAERFIAFSQNHDQIGNRVSGDRLSSVVSFNALKLAAGTVLLSPYIPLLFMGEEYGETSPFLYFVSFFSPDLIDRVRKNRKMEFSALNSKGEPPDPQSEKTFLKSRLQWEKRRKGNNRILLNFYRELLSLRKNIPSLNTPDKNCLEVRADEKYKTVIMKRWKDDSHALILLNFHKTDSKLNLSLPETGWKKILDSSDTIWNGPGTLLPAWLGHDKELTIRGESFALYIYTAS